MSKVFDNSSQSWENREFNPKQLKLVVSNSVSPLKSSLSYIKNSNTGFTSEVRMKSPSLYSLIAHENFHYLSCELILELEADESDTLSVTCDFPYIDSDVLNHFVSEDEELLEMILIQFQMKILKQLLSFCISYKATNLIICINEDEIETLGIYQEIISYVDKIPGKQGILSELVIQTNKKTFNHWNNFMNDVNKNFRQTLWKDQKENPAIREYLKLNPCMRMFC